MQKEKNKYIPGWEQEEKGWRYVKKDGSDASAAQVQNTDGRWYYFNMACYMVTDTTTPDGFYVDANGIQDGQPSSNATVNQQKLGPGATANASPEGWEAHGNAWKYKQADGSYVTNAWMQDTDGKWYYFNQNTYMATGWLLIDHTWYYLHAINGDMQTGWLMDSSDGYWY